MMPKGMPFMIFCSNTLAAVIVCISSWTCILSRIIPAVSLIISVSSPPLLFAAAKTWANWSISCIPLRLPISAKRSSTGRFIRIPAAISANSSVIIPFGPYSTSSSFTLMKKLFSREYPALKNEDNTSIPSLNWRVSWRICSFCRSFFL